MLFVDTSTRWLDGACQTSSTVGSPVSRTRTDVLLSAVSLSSSPITTGQTEVSLEDDRLRALWTDNLPTTTMDCSVASSEMSDEGSTMGETESFYTDNEWLGTYIEDIDEFGSCVDSDDHSIPKERRRHLEQYIEQQSLLTLSSIHHPHVFVELLQQPQAHHRSWNATNECSQRLEKRADEPPKCYYKRLLSMSKSGRKHNKRKAKQYRQAMKEKRSGLFDDEQVVILHYSGDTNSGLDEHEDISVVD
ncbi:uncharacterized protein LOC134181110 [Corticium candelabrum]|uniref:uncharacterized protein LOC134181110 n=1 Tax=Corticium candelabrum TaxID=121492 RepID=UPI002E252D5B|nr:uncharacterized protein LOC134181110 [Corticium candelabrum]